MLVGDEVALARGACSKSVSHSVFTRGETRRDRPSHSFFLLPKDVHYPTDTFFSAKYNPFSQTINGFYMHIKEIRRMSFVFIFDTFGTESQAVDQQN